MNPVRIVSHRIAGGAWLDNLKNLSTNSGSLTAAFLRPPPGRRVRFSVDSSGRVLGGTDHYNFVALNDLACKIGAVEVAEKGICDQNPQWCADDDIEPRIDAGKLWSPLYVVPVPKQNLTIVEQSIRTGRKFAI